MKKGDEGNEKPGVEVLGDMNRKILFEDLKVWRIHASLSHEEEYAVALVTLEILINVDDIV